MNGHSKMLLVIASLFAASSLILASAGAHIAAETLSTNQLTDTFNKAVSYSYYNAISLLGIAVLCQVCINANCKNRFHWAGYCIALGGLIFQSSLFLYTLAGMKWVTTITPSGGLLMILGWILLGVLTVYTSKTDHS